MGRVLPWGAPEPSKDTQRIPESILSKEKGLAIKLTPLFNWSGKRDSKIISNLNIYKLIYHIK